MSLVEMKEYKINEVCESIVDCVNKTAKHVDYETSFKMVRTTNVKSGWINLDEVRYVTEETFKKWTRRVTPQIGDIILTREAPLGEVGLVRTDDKIFLGQRTILYRANKQIADNKFLYYQFLSDVVQAQFSSFGSGSTVEHIRIEDCETFKVFLPQLPIQQRIASILSSYDELIEVNNLRIKLLEETARELYKEWFVRMRFPGYKQAKFVKGIPEGWNLQSLYDIAEITYGYPFDSKLFNEVGNGIPIIRIRDLLDGVSETFTTELAQAGSFGDSDQRVTEQGDQLFRGKLTRRFRGKLTTCEQRI